MNKLLYFIMAHFVECGTRAKITNQTDSLAYKGHMCHPRHKFICLWVRFRIDSYGMQFISTGTEQLYKHGCNVTQARRVSTAVTDAALRKSGTAVTDDLLSKHASPIEPRHTQPKARPPFASSCPEVPSPAGPTPLKKSQWGLGPWVASSGSAE